MALYCKTSELKEMLPIEMSTYDLAKCTGINARQWYKVKYQETHWTTEECADRMLSAIGTPHLYHLLDFKDLTRHDLEVHGLKGYKKGCRCIMCQNAKKVENKKYRQRAKMKVA